MGRVKNQHQYTLGNSKSQLLCIRV